MDPPAPVVEATNGTGTADQSEFLNDSEATDYVPKVSHPTKKLQLEAPENVPTNFEDYLNDSSEAEATPIKAPPPAIPTSVITSAAPTPPPVQEKEAELSITFQPPTEQVPEDLLDGEQGKVTVADLVEKAEDEEEMKEDVVDKKKEEKKGADTMNNEENTTTPASIEVTPMTQEPKGKKSPVKNPQVGKAAELADDWSEDGEDEISEDSTKNKDGKPEEKNNKTAELDQTPVRKSGRAPKPTEKLLEGKQQEKMKAVDDEEESVDAIAAELEKSDSEVKKTGGKKTKSPRKGGPKQGENQEDWVSLIFGENGEKVTEKGKKIGEKEKEGDKSSEELPDAEEFLMEQTQFFTKAPAAASPPAKKGGRPRKKDLDEKMDGVAKLGSNMYFYTGPGATSNDSPINSDEEDESKGKGKSGESARKSGRTNKGKNSRLEREDEVVEMPQAKAKEASLNPSWLKNHDGKKETPVKKGSATPTKASTHPPASAKTKTKEEDAENASSIKEEEEEMEEEEEEEIVKEDVPVVVGTRDSIKLDLDDIELRKLAGKTLKKGEDEYVIVVQGINDTGLCGKYWGDLENLPSRRRSKQPEPLQLGAVASPGRDTPTSRRGSVGSAGSVETPAKKAAVQIKVKPEVVKATPKSNKKQVTKPEKKEKDSVDSSQSEGEEAEVKARGRKRKIEETPGSTEKKPKKGRPKKGDDDEPETTFSDYDSAGGSEPLRKNKGKDSPAKEPAVSSKQQSAVSAALAAGVPAGQQRSVSCVADTSTQREVVVECFAPYDDHRWVNIGKERDAMAPDAVQYARALRPPYHLLSFLRIKGHSTKGMSCTDKNTMVFVVLEGEITVILHTTQFNAKKGDSFYIPPKNYYNLINQKAREAELSLIQFQYDGPLPTVQPTNA